MLYILICVFLQSSLEEKNIFSSMVESALNLKHPKFSRKLNFRLLESYPKKIQCTVRCDFVNSLPSFLSSSFYTRLHTDYQ